jgi:ferredoxin-NADP reductase
MEGRAIQGRLTWQLGTLVDRVVETPKTTSLVFDLPDWHGHLAGQHVDVRLTAEDGYQAERSYSIASAPGEENLTLTVDRIPDGEVSPFLTQELMVGESIEFRGPIGGFFVWEHAFGGPILLVAGGSGVVPMRSMLRHWANGKHLPTCARLLYSARTLDDVIYQRELAELARLDNVEVQIALTRQWPHDWRGHRGRIDKPVLESATWPSGEPGLTYVCGPTPFVEAVASTLVGLGQDPTRIKTERFGPTGS